MLNRISLLALLLAFLLMPLASQAEPLRILTYNIRHGQGTDGKLDLERVAKVIRQVQPDLVALNEVDKGVQRSGQVDQPQKLAELTGLKSVFEKNIDYGGGEYGNAILSRLPITRHTNYPLPSMYDGEQRGMLVATVRLPDDSSLHFAATHFDSRRSDQERLASVRFIRQTIEQDFPDAPFLLAGDFNALPDSKVMRQIDEFWQVVPTTATFPATEPKSRIDYICFRPLKGWRVLEAKVLEEPLASDHRPVLVVLQPITGEVENSQEGTE